ncbi:hypothetical protein OROMI_027006 [Orobanche minor]
MSGGILMTCYKYRKYYEMQREKGLPEDEEDSNFDTIDPTDNSNIYV